ncbi:TetR/AcrR family transcriptional regulator [Longispora albida]|uniref:TetR/AcrR family transcriptional regulator n=1 Tax=Longispora albida TaxID=203523 RepID=UPI00036AD957|nr:TetR/AcrR family transcriptional regulator [Longispora albida]
MNYHHGDLRRALLTAAAEAIAEQGAADLSLRDLARRAGVSHAAPAHHFGDKRGLLGALAAEGYEMLADELNSAGDFIDTGAAYIRFAIGHPGHFEVMFRPALYRAEDVAAAQERAGQALSTGLATTGSTSEEMRRAAWSLVHGYATLALTGNFPPGSTEDPRPVLRKLFER